VSTNSLDRTTVSALVPEALKDIHRLLVLRNDAAELLVAGVAPPFMLIDVEVPKWERVAQTISKAMKEQYEIESICLFPLTLSPEAPISQTQYHVLDARGAPPGAPRGTRWAAINALPLNSFANEADFAALCDTTRKIREFRSDAAAEPFGKPGWIDELLLWAQHELDPYGVRLTGKFRQLNAGPTFALLRLETNGHAVWFKAVGKPNLGELRISQTLFELFPEFVPKLIAAHATWQGWLTTEVSETTLDEVAETGAWKLAAQTLAQLQVKSIGVSNQLLDAGCRDLRISSILAMIGPFVESMSDLMNRQEKSLPRPLREKELHTLGEQIKETLLELAELNVPDALGHLDFNPGNILCLSGRCIFIDWAEAYVGPPFLTFEYLRAYLLRQHPQDRVLTTDVAEAYGMTWCTRHSPLAVAAALNLAPVLAVVAYAVGIDAWRNAISLHEPATAGYFRSLTRRIQSEMRQLHARRQLCCE